jgi:glycerophosphoryl diester phosphodiesterase
MMKGGRQAKLLAKENQAKKRAEKIFSSFNKENLKKLKEKIIPHEVSTPQIENRVGHNFTESTDTSPGVNSKLKMSRTLGRKSKYTLRITTFSSLSTLGTF